MRWVGSAVSLALLVTSCASSTTPAMTERDRDGGPGGADAGRRDSGPGGTDAGPGGSDSGPVEMCTPGEEDFCTSSCGTTGRRSCGSSGTFGPCYAPPEDCNGTDDDCDGMADEAIAPRMCSSACGGGSESCTSATWVGCTATMPGMETCDGTDEDCDSRIDEGLTRACSTACGAGMETCNAGSWIGCTAPRPLSESCNGADDDCDGSPDDGLSRSCSTACGSGTETCSAGSWVSCTAPAPMSETCNGADDDCNGTTDDGFRVRTESTTYTTLSGRHSVCNGSGQRIGPDCNAAIHRHCGASACNSSGFGPVENSGDTAHVTCVAGTTRGVTFATLASHHGVCDGSAERMGPNCNAAIHRYCASQGFESGYGPVESSGSNADVTCLPSSIASTRMTSYSALSSHHAPCDGSAERWGANCNAAIHRWCTSQGFESGFGPVENSGDTAYVTCVRD